MIVADELRIRVVASSKIPRQVASPAFLTRVEYVTRGMHEIDTASTTHPATTTDSGSFTVNCEFLQMCNWRCITFPLPIVTGSKIHLTGIVTAVATVRYL